MVSAAACAGGGQGATDSISASSVGSLGDDAASEADDAAQTGVDDPTDGGDAGSSEGPGSGDDGSAGDTGGGGVFGACPPGVAPSFPGAQWSTLTADEAGLDNTAVGAFIEATGGAHGVLVRCGYVVAAWGSPEAPIEWGGVTRAVTSTMLVFAAQEGRIASVDAAVAPLGWGMQGEDTNITLRQIANETSGYGLPETPGSAWGYNDLGLKLFTLSVYERLFDDGSADAAVRNAARLGPLQFTGGALFEDVSGAPRFTASPSDAARLGWFWANAGQWNGVALLSPASFAELATADVPAALPRTAGGAVDDYLGIGTAGGGADQTGLGPGIYGFGFWFNPGGATFPGVPSDALVANGHWNGEVIAVVPSLGLVAAFAGSGADAEAFLGPLADLMAALVDTVVA
jgi:hypothetical protein